MPKREVCGCGELGWRIRKLKWFDFTSHKKHVILNKHRTCFTNNEIYDLGVFAQSLLLNKQHVRESTCLHNFNHAT